MDEHRIGQIMKSVASCLPEERAKKITNHSTRKTVVAKLKEAGQPLHKIIQVTARESSLDDCDKTTESERYQLSCITSGYAATSTLSVIVQRSIAGNYFFLLSRSRRYKHERKYPANLYGSGNMPPFFTPS